jgi:hypothetical protein
MARRRLVAATCVLFLRSSASLRVALCVTGQLRTFDREAVRESQAQRLVGDLRRHQVPRCGLSPTRAAPAVHGTVFA